MGYRKALLSGGLFLTLAALAITVSGSFFLSVFAISLGVIAVFFSVFETNGFRVERTVLIAVLSAAAAAGRVLFTAIPSVQPVSFIVILTGMVFGVEAGFLTGAMSAMLSSLMMGFGPWTVWQMTAWGLIGCFSALFRKALFKGKIVRTIYSVLCGFSFGWILNLWMMFTAGSEESAGLAYVLAIYLASLPFDTAHGVFTALLMFLAGDRMLKVLNRAAEKYGLS